MSCTAGVTKPSAVPRHVTMAGSQMRLGRTWPPLPMGRGVKSRAVARGGAITRGSALVVLLVVVVRAAGRGVGVQLVLDPVLGQPVLQRGKGRPIRRRAV